MNKDIENIIKKEKIDSELAIFWDKMSSYLPKSIERNALGDEKIFTALKQAYIEFRPLIADEVLKVVVETLDIEKLAELEHEQWENWSKSIASLEKLTPERLQRWEELWINYKNLPEDQKEHDRFYARKILQLLSNLSPNKENK